MLKGCYKLIKKKRIGIIITEIMFDDVYDKYFSFNDIEKYLLPFGFRMVGINLVNNNLFSGVDLTLTESNLFVMVAVLSSAARIPFPADKIFKAIEFNSDIFN